MGATLVYLAVVLLIGLWSVRRTRDARDFFIAGQRPGLWVVALATMASAFSGFVFVGGPGLTYRMGIASLWIVLPVGFTAGLLCWSVGLQLRRLAGSREVYTIPDAVGCRFGPRAAGLAALAVALGSVAYLGSQLLAARVVLRAFFGVESLALALGLGLAVLVGYSTLGGMVAGLYTDVVQGTIMLLAAVAVFVRAMRVAGGWGELSRSISASDAFGPEFLEPLGSAGPFTAFGFFFVFGVGVLGQPQMLHKFFMLRDARQLRWMPLVLGGSQATCLLIWIGIGLAVPALVAQGRLAPLTRPDDAAPTFLLEQTPALLAGVVVAAILAAIMSTSDAFINIGAAALARDLPRALGRPLADELAWGRAAVLAVTAGAAALAWVWGDLIALLGTFAFGTFAAALAPVLAVGLNWRAVTPAAAVGSIATGTLASLVLELVDTRRWLAPGVPPSAVALAASFTVLFVVTAFTRTWQEPLA